MNAFVNLYSGSGYASPNIVQKLAAQVASTTQTGTATSIPPKTVGEFDPAAYGGAATASVSAMQAILQLTQGGYANASSSGTDPASGDARWYTSQGIPFDDSTQSTTLSLTAAEPVAAGASSAGASETSQGLPVAAKTLTGADEAGVKDAPRLVTGGDAAFSSRLAAASSDNHIASIKALAGLAGELRTSARSGSAHIEAESSATVRLEASPDSEAGKTYAVLQKLAQDGDRYIASAAKSLLSRITGVFSNGVIEFKSNSISHSLLAVTTGKAAQALSRFADEQIVRLAHDMADGKSVEAERPHILNALRAIETGTAVVIPTGSLPFSSKPYAGQPGIYKLLAPPNSAFLENGAYTAIFPDSSGPAPKWT